MDGEEDGEPAEGREPESDLSGMRFYVCMCMCPQANVERIN